MSARPGGSPDVRERTFIGDLWRSIEPVYAAIIEHPFLCGLADGTLPEECFRHYVLQDLLYLRDYAIAGASSPDEDVFLMFNGHA